MTEEQWMTCTRQELMLRHLRDPAAECDRRLILFMAACCRRVQKWFTHLDQYEAVEVIDRFADGAVSRDDLGSARAAVSRLAHELRIDSRDAFTDDGNWVAAAYHAAVAVAYAARCADPPTDIRTRFVTAIDVSAFAARAPYYATRAHDSECQHTRTRHAGRIECIVQSRLLRCIFGNPFRPFTFAPAWRTETTVALATGIFEDRAFDRLPILADALEEAGCDVADVMAHCRGPGPHARGCWVVDGLLGKT